MTNVWIDTIFDRDYGDIQAVMYNPTLVNPKGCYNYIDLNRIENNTAYVLEYMLEHKIIRSAPALRIKTDWVGTDIVVASEMKRIVENVQRLCELSNPIIQEDLPQLYLASQVNYTLANDIERALEIMHTQPELPIDYFLLKLNNGIITTIDRLDGTTETINANQAYIAEDEIAHITGVPYGEDAQYQVFTAWSGNTDDLQYIGNVTDQTTTYTGQYHDVEFTANFKTVFPRTLTLTNAYISLNGDDKAESGPRSGVYHAGDNIMIIADVAPTGKAFYCWEGTPEALDAISVADTDPSTVWLAMPDKNVELHPKYINAGQHYVTVTNGSGSGWYDYNESVYISANVPDHYGFDNWSGDTSYLEDIYSSGQSIKMPDVNISFRANYSYRYSYNNVQVLNGKIRVNNEDVTSAQGLRQSSSYTLVPTPPDNSQGIDYWQVEGLGSISGNTFTVGDGNAVITGHYAPIRTMTVANINNGGGSSNYTAVQGHTYSRPSTDSRVGDYTFDGWYQDGTRISTSTTLPSITAGTENITITAQYSYNPVTPTVYVTLRQINKNNAGTDTSSQIVQGNYVTVSTSEVANNQILEGIYKNGTKVTSSASYSFYCSTDTTIEFKYRDKEYYTLTVQNGHIVETGETSGTYLERTSVQITADDPAVGATFTGWSVTSGSLYSSTSSKTGNVIIGRSNATITAQYKNLRTIQVTTNSGTNTYTMIQGNSQRIVANPAPSTYEFDKWVCTSGDATFGNYLSQDTYVYANSQNSVVEAQYKAIPWFNVTVQNGYVQINNEWVTSGIVLRNSAPAIKMKPAPEGYQFFQWEIVTGDNNDVYQPLAETTYLRNVTHDIVVKATYYIPDPEVKYTLTVTQKDGTIETYNNPAGYQQNIMAQSPDEGYRFYRWNGDYQYLVGGRYAADNVVNTPARNIELQATYVREDYVTKYHLYMYSAECLISRTEDPDTHEITETWATDGEFEEGTKVEIRTKNIPFGWRFNGWQGTDDAQTALIEDLMDETTKITIGDFDCYITATIIENAKYTLKITNGQTSGEYYEDYRADVYFDKPDTANEHYTFTRWTGDIAYISLYDGGVFDVLNPGTSSNPQYIRMPARRIELVGNYTTGYHLTVNNGTIDTQGEYFAEGTVVPIIADTIQGKVFTRWEGDTDGIGSIYDPTTTITIGTSAKVLTAKYANEADRNNIGYGLISFVASDIINIEDITIISGTLGLGFIISDSLGHLYVVNQMNAETVGVTRMTKILKGGDVYE